jgi:outer membrane usher protein
MMNMKIRILIVIHIFFALNVNASEAVLEENIANLWINDLDHHTDVALLKEGDQYYIECNILAERQITTSQLKTLSSRPEFCSVSSGVIQSAFDDSSQSIKLTIPTDSFESDFNNLNGSVIPEKASFGGFINYDFLYATSNSNNSYSGLMELGVFKDYWIMKNSMLYQNTPTDERVVRLSSSVDFEFPKHMTRLTIGDTTTTYNPLINSLRFAGLNWGTNYTERPNFVYWNMPSLQGSARVPSTVDLYINGVNIYNQKVSPGDYNLLMGAQIQQAGNAQIVVEDVLGNRSVQSFPIMVTNRLLRSGLNEYSVAAGKLRYNYNLDSSDYRDFFVNTYFRRGMSNSTTLGSNLSYSKDIQNIGFMWTQAISNIFVLDSVVLASHDDENQFNYSYGLSASKDFGRFSMGASSKYTEKDFKFLGDELGANSNYPKFENLAYFGMSNVPYLHNLNINYAEQKYYENPDFPNSNQKVINVGFNRNFGRRISFGLSYFNSFGDRKDSGGILSLSYSFDNKSVYFSQSADQNTNLQLVKYDSNQVGFDYSLGVNRRSEDTMFNFNGVVKTDVGDLDFYHVQGREDRESQLNYRGAVVWLGNKISFTKMVDNAFTLVKVGDYQDIDILRSLTYVDKTNKKGYAFIHDVIPYVKYDIAFDQNQLPIEDKIQYSSKQLTALNQRGYIINFPVFHAKQVTVKPVDSNNRSFAAGSELYIDNNGEGEVYPISTDGSVTLYGLIPGIYKIQIKTKEARSCSAELTITDTKNDDNSSVLDLQCK